jgi:hypothetical protein
LPEIVDPVFAKTSQNARFLLSENERFGLVFVKTGSINSGTVLKIKLRFAVSVSICFKCILALSDFHWKYGNSKMFSLYKKPNRYHIDEK